MKKSFKAKMEPYLYVFPALFILIVFVYYPFFLTIIGSMFKVNIYGELKDFIFLKNYSYLLTDGNFYKALWQTLYHTIVYVVLSVGISLFLAIIADKKSRFYRIYRVLYSLTMIISVSIAAQLFRFLYSPAVGPINKIFGLDINWLVDRRFAMLALTLIMVWITIGFNYIYLSAAIKNVPADILESAEIDGATTLQKIYKFIIPLISPSLFFLIVTGLITGLTMITPVLILTEGGPDNTTTTLIYSMYNFAFNKSNYSVAYAYGVIVFIIVAVVVAFNFMYEKKKVFYG
ncbi:sn-glycerol-3-phosphate transport system permease protein UgpA [Fusobacterium sp. DD29]|uniref:carbohydrate ABC transporter permease n=1 Tax=unclassified Fusobacterium TaxID=2648384 RepID=UPI001B8B74A1|nr:MULTISPECIES: sugar ABC transporter permease [unclassified Fusobacterium]MBR8701626.1 sn-glycerol-3-phosphate transport system permease protein UgpA [Fusobacterium sp. DD45]MBR8711407.1 sn-glycerol-3-phosphate transport system permease protein UgpA [Fusobacterium sp. DD28]MBR8749850.1 sn-glycerol-3-phosphate transport system permease protein UgpA [Fusobacterium sp. DD29]MBR8751964.1 sn-glycerol-3-phosphate transport system permease protein UgpA [Fusobacterium sp. DD26]MBR8762092.1 sn-glycer